MGGDQNGEKLCCLIDEWPPIEHTQDQSKDSFLSPSVTDLHNITKNFVIFLCHYTPQKYELNKLIIYQNIIYFSVFMLFNNLILKVKFHFQREKRYKIKVRVYCSSSKELKVGGRVNQFSIIGWSRRDQALCQESPVIQCYFKNRHGQINNKVTNLVNILIIFLWSQ